MSIFVLPLKEDGNIERGFNEIYVPYTGNDKELRELGLSFNMLNELETLGVLKFDSIMGYKITGISNKRVLICIGEKLDVIEKHDENSIPSGDVMLTSVGEVLKNITDGIDIEGYHDMVKKSMLGKRIKFAENHDFIAVPNGDTLNIERKIKE